MQISSAEFIISNTDISRLPSPVLPEFAFIGRSNVGKSSLINMLVNNNKLAKTSSTPGKTQTINHFLINKNWYLVDLPGYGFAKVSQTQRSKWQGMIGNYISKRENLMAVFVLVDIRVPPQQSDIEMISQLGKKNIPVAIIYTKTDKLTRSKINLQVKQFEKAILEYWEESPASFLTSAESGSGRDELLEYIFNGMKSFRLPA